MSRNNTGNPIDSRAFPDFEDNVKNLDRAVNSDQDTFKDRLGRSRLTWAGIERAGTGDPGEIVRIVSGAVQDVVDGVEGQADRAESEANRAELGADRAELAADAAASQGKIYSTPAAGQASSELSVGDYFWVVSSQTGASLELWQKGAATPADTGRRLASALEPSYGYIASGTATVGSIAVDTVEKTVTLTGRVVAGRRSFLLPSPAVLSYSGVSANSVISVSLIDGQALLTPVSALFNIPDGHVNLGMLIPSTGEVIGAAVYTIDGEVPGGGGDDRALVSRSGYLYGSPTSVSVNTTAKTIRISSARLLTVGGYFSSIPTQTIDYSPFTTSARRYVAVNLDSLAVTLHNTNNVPIDDRHVIVGNFHPITLEMQGFPGGYTVDSAQFGMVSKDSGVLYATSQQVTVDTAQNKILFAGGVVVPAKSLTWLVNPPRELDISSTVVDSLIVFDNGTKIPSLVPVASHNTLTLRDVVVGVYHPDSRRISGLPGGYNVDGEVPGGGGDEGGFLLPAIGWSMDGVYSAPALPGHTQSDPVPAVSVTSAMINGWFDELVSQHPEYVTRTHLGDDATGLPIYEYRFRPDSSPTPGSQLVRVMIQGGIHAEPMSYLFPYYAMQQICGAWESSGLLEALRWGVEFSVIPALAPWCIDNSSRYNSNGVNINRNYPVGWQAGQDNPGPAPLSELETQYSYSVMGSFRPHVFLDAHSFATDESGAFLWFPASGSTEAKWAGGALVNMLAQKWRREHDWMPPASVLGRPNDTLRGGGATGTANDLGSIGVTYEVGTRLRGEPGGAHYNSLAVTYATESLINYLAIVFRRNAA